jgi:hypothetical protein
MEYSPQWPKAPIAGPQRNERSRIADAQAMPMDVASFRLQSTGAPRQAAAFLIA